MFIKCPGTHKRILLVFVFLFLLPSVFSLEVGAFYSISTLAFDRERDAAAADFPFHLAQGTTVFLHQALEEKIRMEVEYSHDFILQNIMTALFIYRGDFFSFGVGPFLGMFNEDNYIPQIGISSYFRIEWPGVIYTEIWLDNTTGNPLMDSNIYIQERFSLSLGFYVPFAICSVNFDLKQFTLEDGSNKVIDTFTEYSFVTDIFKKNAPFTVAVTFAFQSLSKVFQTSGATTSEQIINSLILGLTLDFELGPYLTMIIDLDNSIYTFGTEDLLGVSNSNYLFTGKVGFVLNIDKIIEDSRVGSKKEPVSDEQTEPETETAPPEEAQPPAADETSDDAFRRFEFGITSGAYYHIDPNIFFLANIRISAGCDFMFNIAPVFSLGLETSFRLFYVQDDQDNTLFFIIDMPVRALLSLNIGMFRIQPFGGLYMVLMNWEFIMNYDAGLKLAFVVMDTPAHSIDISIEGSYIFCDETTNALLVYADHIQVGGTFRFTFPGNCVFAMVFESLETKLGMFVLHVNMNKVV